MKQTLHLLQHKTGKFVSESSGGFYGDTIDFEANPLKATSYKCLGVRTLRKVMQRLIDNTHRLHVACEEDSRINARHRPKMQLSEFTLVRVNVTIEISTLRKL